jgi:hypothetical protein
MGLRIRGDSHRILRLYRLTAVHEDRAVVVAPSSDPEPACVCPGQSS